MFDTVAYLEDRGIAYKTSGKNISAGWIGVCCPFCGDQNYHLGISQTGGFTCWRCGTKGYITKLIKELESCNFSEIHAIIETFSGGSFVDLKQDIRKRLGDNILPSDAKKEFLEIHLDYLTNRRFSPDLIDQYNLYACDFTGNYKFRIIVPVIEKGAIVSFTALAVSGQQPKYIHCGNKESIIPIKHCLYNIDTVKDTVIITEGVTDVWRIGGGCVATFGLEYTSEQIQLLVSKGIKKAYVMFDSETFAIKKARKLSDELSLFMESETIELDKGDPGEFTDQQVMDLRREIFNG